MGGWITAMPCEAAELVAPAASARCCKEGEALVANRANGRSADAGPRGPGCGRSAIPAGHGAIFCGCPPDRQAADAGSLACSRFALFNAAARTDKAAPGIADRRLAGVFPTYLFTCVAEREEARFQSVRHAFAQVGDIAASSIDTVSRRASLLFNDACCAAAKAEFRILFRNSIPTRSFTTPPRSPATMESDPAFVTVFSRNRPAHGIIYENRAIR